MMNAEWKSRMVCHSAFCIHHSAFSANDHVTERPGAGLQSLKHRFDSCRGLMAVAQPAERQAVNLVDVSSNLTGHM
jgi:hypothetical protein